MIKIAFFPGSFKPPHVGHFTIVKELLQKVDRLYIFISAKPRDGITAEQSMKIWKIYLSDTDMKKIIIHITKVSPIMATYKTISELKNDDLNIYLIKSKKDSFNKRFEMFDKLKSKYNILSIHEWILPTFKTISSTNMRKTIKDNDYKNFKKFVPLHLSERKIKDVWNIVKNNN